jgi:ribosomal peptide maturation radical SAM protein 1
MKKQAAQVALVSMPFISVHRPGLAPALLKAILRQHAITCDTHHLFIAFAERIGLVLHERLSVISDRSLAGERLFAADLFGPDFAPQLTLPAGYAHGDPEESLESTRTKLRAAVAPFLDDCVARIPWGQYRIVGFSTMFEQNLASLALAKRIKHRWPETIIVFGGANCEGQMGLELHRQFPFVDYVCSGEGDRAFPELVKNLLAGRPAPRVPGLIRREGGRSLVGEDGGISPIVQVGAAGADSGRGLTASPVQNLDELPFPDYDDYFEQLGASSLQIDSASVDLSFETSRGCWYGAKHHCTFCGLNGDTMAYRSKSPPRALAEIRHLAGQYGVRRMQATDNILDTRYLAELLPELARNDLKPSLFYEIKANLRREQLVALKRAGIDRLQPGIESFSTPILQLMRKGCSALQNLQTLKWASELQIELFWNFLMGFPGEDPQEYERMAAMIPSIVHLTPPIAIGLVRLDRFSPYFTAPEQLGIAGVRPAPPYSAIYPFPEESLRRLAYFFDYDHADGRDPHQYTEGAARMMRYWQQNYCAYSFASLERGDTLILRDRRPCSVESRATLTGLERAAYKFLDAAHPLPAVRTHLRQLGYEVKEHLLQGQLEDWSAKRWVVRDGDSYLALAVRLDEVL